MVVPNIAGGTVILYSAGSLIKGSVLLAQIVGLNTGAVTALKVTMVHLVAQFDGKKKKRRRNNLSTPIF